jgi:hypothetical protein
MYSFAQRTDTRVVDEPFYGYYLSIRPVGHPGREEIVATMETNPRLIVESLLSEIERPVLFIKNMAHHLIDIEDRFLRSVRNVFLIRHPRQLIASFAQVIPEPTMNDIGITKQHELYEQARSYGEEPLVLDSGELLRDPEAILRKLCAALGIPFTGAMLSWEPGPIPEDGIWAKYWYGNVHRSRGFEVQHSSNRPFPDRLRPLLDEALPVYDVMFRCSIRTGD